MTIRQADEFVHRWHRHHKPTGGRAKFAIGALVDGEVVGVLIAGRPIARGLDDGATLEILRVATDGTRNACSFLLSKARKAAPHLGYRRVLTYILASETGASLRAAGFVCTGTVAGREFSTPARVRRGRSDDELQDKLRFEAPL